MKSALELQRIAILNAPKKLEQEEKRRQAKITITLNFCESIVSRLEKLAENGEKSLSYTFISNSDLYGVYDYHNRDENGYPILRWNHLYDFAVLEQTLLTYGFKIKKKPKTVNLHGDITTALFITVSC